MFAYCADPSTLTGWWWFSCYLTSATHIDFYQSFGVVLLLLALAAPSALALGMAGAMAARARFWPLALVGRGYVNMVRGIPDIIFFLFVPIALDQAIEVIFHYSLCPGWTEDIWQGNDFRVCEEARTPAPGAPVWVRQTYGFILALIAFALVFGAFVANTLKGAMDAVPHAQVETAEAYGMTRAQAFRRVVLPQMWIYALPGLSNLWMILTKATPLLFLLGIQVIVYWARELGGQKTGHFTYPHPDWRLWYFLVVLAFYLTMTWGSQKLFDRLMLRVNRGQATAGGEAQRRAAA